MATIEIELSPRKQFRPFLLRSERFACVVAHRRAGKTFACIQDLLRAAMSTTRPGPPPRFGYIAPTRDQAKDIAWQYLTEYSSKIPGVKFNQADLSISYPNKSTIRLYSGDSYERMRGLYFDGVVVDEPADIDPNAWTYVILPCLSDYSGWATFIGTCKGKNAFHKMFHKALVLPDWFTLSLKASESGIIKPDEMATLKAIMPPEAYAQEYECDWSVGLPGAIYADLVENARQDGRVSTSPLYEPSALVWTTWDLGAPENTAIWFWQEVGGEIRLLECESGENVTLAERVGRILRRPYAYGGHLLPHDGAATNKNGLSVEQELRAMGFTGVRIIPRTVEPWNGINRMRELMPRCRFALPGCERGLESLECYHRRQHKDGDFITDEIVHDWSSHTADAFRYIGEAMLHGLVRNVGSIVSPRRAEAVSNPRRRHPLRLVCGSAY